MGPGFTLGQKPLPRPFFPIGYAARPHRAWGRAFCDLLALQVALAARGGAAGAHSAHKAGAFGPGFGFRERVLGPPPKTPPPPRAPAFFSNPGARRIPR